jgi:acyl-CoA hydrolase
MVNGVLTSRILPQFPAGSVVSTPRHQLDVIITEYGIAELEGRSIRERSRALAMIGHPQFRDELLANAEQWPKD